MPWDALDKDHLPIESDNARLKKSVFPGKFIAHGFENRQPTTNYIDAEASTFTNFMHAIIHKTPEDHEIVTLEDVADEDEVQVTNVITATIHQHSHLAPTFPILVDLTGESTIKDISSDPDPIPEVTTL